MKIERIKKIYCIAVTGLICNETLLLNNGSVIGTMSILKLMKLNEGRMNRDSFRVQLYPFKHKCK